MTETAPPRVAGRPRRRADGTVAATRDVATRNTATRNTESHNTTVVGPDTVDSADIADTADAAVPAPAADTATVAAGERPLRRGGPAPAALVAVSEWSWRLIVSLIALGLVFALLVFLSELTIALAISILLAGLLYPVTDFLGRHHVKGGLGSLATLLLLLVFVGGLGTLVGTRVASGYGDLASSVGKALSQLQGQLGRFGVTTSQLSAAYDRIRDTLTSGGAGGLASSALSVGSSIGHGATGAVITLFSLFFFLHDGRRMWRWAVGLFPDRAGQVVDGAGRRAFAAVTGYVRATVVVAAADAVGIYIVARILRVPLALPLAVIVFLGAFVPIVGTLASGTVSVLVAFVSGGPLIALLMLAGVLLVVEIEGHVLQPLLLGRAVGLHPLAVFLAITAGGLIAGIVGVLLAVPVLAAVVSVLRGLRPPDPDGAHREPGRGRRRFLLFGRRRRTDTADVDAARIGAAAAAGGSGGPR